MPTIVIFPAKTGGVALWKAAAVVVGTLGTAGGIGYGIGKHKKRKIPTKFARDFADGLKGLVG